MVKHGASHGLEAADVVIRPDLQGVGSTDWRKSDQIADLGYAAAAANASALTDLALSEEDWQAHVEEVRARMRSAEIVPDFVAVEGAARGDNQAISRRFQDFIGKPLDTDRLAFELTALTGTNRYESLSYEATLEGEEEGLLVRAKEKDYGPPFINFSLGLSNQAEEIFFDFGTRLTAYDVGRYGAEVRTDVAIGTVLGLFGEYYRPLGNTRVFVAPRGLLSRTTSNFFEDETLIASFTTIRARAGADVGLALGRDSELRIGYDFGDVDFGVRVGDPVLPEADGKEERARLRWIYDGQDSALIPSQGVRVVSSVRYFLDTPTESTEFGTVEARASVFWPLGGGHRIALVGAGGTSFDRPVPLLYEFSLGGPLRLTAYDEGEFRGDQFLLGSAAYLRQVARLPDFVGGSIFLTGLVELGSAFDDIDDIDDAELRASFSGGLLMEMGLGTLAAVVAVGDDGSTRFVFSLGRNFR
jgi:NTE family protein